MANEIVKYQNELNLVPMRNFNSNEMDLFFVICSKMKQKKLDTVRFHFEQLKELSNYKATATKRFADDLEHTYDKMLRLTYGQKKDGIRSKFVLFTGFEINEHEKYVDISINPKLEYVLNALEKEFTRFELEEFTNLKSSYAKSMYRLLKQFRSTGFYLVSIDEFRELLDIPNSYPMRDVDKRVIAPIEKELKFLFDDLKITKIKAKKGNKIAQLQFTFKEKKHSAVPLHNWIKE